MIGMWNETYIIAVAGGANVHIGDAFLAQFFIVVCEGGQVLQASCSADLRHECVTWTSGCRHPEIEVTCTKLHLFSLDEFSEMTVFMICVHSLCDIRHSHSILHCFTVCCSVATSDSVTHQPIV